MKNTPENIMSPTNEQQLATIVGNDDTIILSVHPDVVE
jgi:hypothetical protein